MLASYILGSGGGGDVVATERVSTSWVHFLNCHGLRDLSCLPCCVALTEWIGGGDEAGPSGVLGREMCM